MKAILAAAIIALATPAMAGEVGSYVQHRGNGDALVFYLYDDKPDVSGCSYGHRANIVLFDATSRSGLPYATGCWNASDDIRKVSVHLITRSLGEQHESAFSTNDVKLGPSFSGWYSYTGNR